MQKMIRDGHEPGRLLKVVLTIAAVVVFAAVIGWLVLFLLIDSLVGNIIGALIPLLLVGYWGYWVFRRRFEMRQLATAGVETTGTVTRKLLFRRNWCQIKYAYQDAFGKEHHHVSFASRELYDSLEVGSPIKVVYLPSRPSVSGLLSDAENARHVLHRRSSRT